MGCKSHLEMLFTYPGSRNYLGLMLRVVGITTQKHPQGDQREEAWLSFWECTGSSSDFELCEFVLRVCLVVGL